MTADTRPDSTRLLGAQVWAQVCRHIDGLAIGSTMAALHQQGALQAIAASGRALIGVLLDRLGANPGYFQVAIRLLADQGWVEYRGEHGTDALAVEVTRCGRTVLAELADGYSIAARFLPVAAQTEALLFGTSDPAGLRALAEYSEIMRTEWGLPPRALPVRARLQVLSHLDGHVVAPLMAALGRHDLLRPGTEIRLDRPATACNAGALRLALSVLARQGWVTADAATARLTPAGVVAVACARQYWYPVTYLPLLRTVPQLIFGAAPGAWAERADGVEDHLDRELDIRMSGEVFTSICQEPFFQVALPLFDRQPIKAQPAMVVDSGCGDGTVLAALYSAVRERTLRGRHLAEHPLLMVGTEPSPVARRVASARLRADRIPHLIIDGDIADPDALGQSLTHRGLDAANALHLSKSVIHDRRYREPGQPDPAADPPPACPGAFATADGAAISPIRMAHSLAEFFASWRGLAHRHGLLIIEAHATNPATTAGLLGRTIATALDATHGYSCQYLVEPGVFSWAAQQAGFRSRGHRDLGTEKVGHTTMTIDHFIPAGRAV